MCVASAHRLVQFVRLKLPRLLIMQTIISLFDKVRVYATKYKQDVLFLAKRFFSGV